MAGRSEVDDSTSRTKVQQMNNVAVEKCRILGYNYFEYFVLIRDLRGDRHGTRNAYKECEIY